MNPRITDLLDDYADTSVQLFSPDQVLRGTGSGKKKSPTQKPAHHRMKKPLVAAAALLLVLTGIAAGYLTFSRGSSGTSLGDGMSEIPEISAVSPTPEPTQENVADSAESAVETVPEDIVLDDTNSVIVTSGATGLSMRVPTEFQDGMKIDDCFGTPYSISSSDLDDFCFAFFDTSNMDHCDGLVFAIDVWDQSDLDAYLSNHTRDFTFELNSAVVGTDGTSYYRMLQFGNPSSTSFPHFDNTNLDTAKAYYDRIKYVIPMVNSFIELNDLDTTSALLDDWAKLFRQRMLEPMEVLIAQLEDTADTQEAEQTEESTAELDLSPAEDLHIAEPTGDRSAVETSTLTSATGLSITVLPECMDAGEFYVDDTITLTNKLSCNIDVVFAAFDQRNLDSGGFLWAIIDGSPDSMPLDLPDGYQWDVMGQLDGETYSIIMPTADNLQFDENSLADTMSYDNHVQAMHWNLSDVIRAVTNYSPYEDATQDWERDYVKLVSDPVYERLTELEAARQNSLQPSDSSLNLPAAQDTDSDGLLTAKLNIPVETEYGTAILKKFTLDPSSLEFSWYIDLSALSGSFAEYGSDLAAALKEHEDFQVEYLEVQNAVQEVILNGMLVYPDNSHVCMSSGERIDFDDQGYRTFDTLGVATLFPTSDEAPSCLEIGGVTYSLS